MTGPTVVTACPECAEPVGVGDAFCEACGTPLAPTAPEVHDTVTTAAAAATTDRGRVHPHNQDAFALRVGAGDAPTVIGPAVVVVCDGVSSSVTPERAARAAADAAADTLSASLADGAPDLPAAIAAARRTVEAIAWTPRGALPAPSCTLVAAAWDGTTITVGSVGDSRAYWIGSDGAAAVLTRDDSWARHQVDLGLMTAAEAERHPNAHGITDWIGADAPDDPPEVTELRPEVAGLLLVCSDGLWNYASDADDLAAVVRALLPASPSDLADALVGYALGRGGHDNVTVAVLALDPRSEEPA